MKLCCSKCQYRQELAFLPQPPEASLLAPLWNILHTNKQLEWEGFVTFRPYFSCIVWPVESWRGWMVFSYLFSTAETTQFHMRGAVVRGGQGFCAAVSSLPCFPFPSALGSSYTFFFPVRFLSLPLPLNKIDLV